MNNNNCTDGGSMVCVCVCVCVRVGVCVGGVELRLSNSATLLDRL